MGLARKVWAPTSTRVVTPEMGEPERDAAPLTVCENASQGEHMQFAGAGVVLGGGRRGARSVGLS